MLQTIVKISTINNLSDARYCAGMGVEMLGFSMDELPLTRFTEIRNWVAGVLIVGETDLVDIEQIKSKVAEYQPDILQINEPRIIPDLKQLGIPIILKIDFNGYDFSEHQSCGETYLLIENSDEFAHLEPQVLSQLMPLVNAQDTLLGFGITEGNLKETLDELPLKGIALNGGQELRPGYRDFDELMNLLEILEVED